MSLAHMPITISKRNNSGDIEQISVALLLHLLGLDPLRDDVPSVIVYNGKLHLH